VNKGEDGKKNGRNEKKGITISHHLFVSTPCNYEFANDSMVSQFSFSY
jgi:hypothetical protein